ncbi:hypothetical protein [Candidatus Deianiraea vastatrix]|uniref:Uncharacterized protein n=1 Tax=Candidatus Deianiraea vastatrix TaxID=2163644 RepID=A0A5B8XFP9_9RICK|nr:hypothetical protein [Candidatus Deianiraea vastatrix]QED23735.1 hypothetical protein Deia_00948 [Candidatus Deianiraea vastatrix]
MITKGKIEQCVNVLSLSILVAFSCAHIQEKTKQNRIQSVISDYTVLKNGINKFHISYQYYPGDVPINKISGSISESQKSAYLAQSRGNQLGNGRIEYLYSARVAFIQLAMSNIIPKIVNPKAEIHEDSSLTLAKSANVTLPVVSGYSDKSVWYITTDTSDKYGETIGPDILRQKDVYAKNAKKVKLIIANYVSINTLYPINNADIGGLTVYDANMIDRKIDDGNGYKSTGIMFADNTLIDNNCVHKNGEYKKKRKDISYKNQCFVAMTI